MNKLKTVLTILKWIGILLLMGYLYLVVLVYNNPMSSSVKGKPFIDRLEEAFAEALYVGVGSVIMYFHNIFD